MPVICNVIHCNKPAVLKRPKTGDPLCKECFFYAFESEIHVTIIGSELFKRGDKVAIGASGGKDSTVLAYILKLLNEKYDYGLDLFLLSIDEGITGYRDDSLETVKQNKIDYQLPLKILSYKDLYGWTMDEIVAQIGRKNNCTFCGVFRRQALDRGAALLGADMIVTGHNADDIAETVIMNVLRGDIARLARCTKIVTEGEGTIPRCKPLKYAYEKEIVMYAHYKNLVYFSTECMYAPNAYRGHTREYIKEIERVRPTCILDIIHSGETVQFKKNVKFPERRTCTRCGFIASQEICKACVLLEGLNRGMPKLGITKSNKARRVMGLKVDDGSENKGKKPEKPIYESKRKMRRDMRKKKACGENCGDSGCGSKNPQPCTSTADIDPFMLTPDENFEEKLLQENEKPNVSNDLLESNEKELQNEASGVSSGLAKPKIKPDEEIAQGCGGLDDWASEALPTGLSSDDEEIIEIKEKKEKVVCKCPQELKKKAKDSPINTDTETEDEDMSGGMFNIQLFKALASAYNPDLIEALKEHESPEEFKKIEDIHRKIRENDKKVEQEFLELRKMFENKEKNIEEEQSSTSTAERLPWLQRETIDEALSSTSETKESESCSGNQAQENVEVKSKDDLEDVNEFSEELLSELLKMTINEEINTEEGQPSTSITERLPWLQRETADEALSFLSATKESESCTENEAPEHLNVKQSSEDEPTIVKAKAKKKQPSLMLPEMIHKAPNKLDF